MRRTPATVAAIEEVYRRRGRDFFRFALARTGHPELAQDAVQEGFARAIRARSSFRGAGALDAWIGRCVVNAARDLAERTEPSDPAIADPDGGTDAAVVLQVRQAVRELPLRQREVLFLRFYLDFEYSAIAAALDIEVGTVSATLHAARQHLTSALEEART